MKLCPCGALDFIPGQERQVPFRMESDVTEIELKDGIRTRGEQTVAAKVDGSSDSSLLRINDQ